MADQYQRWRPGVQYPVRARALTILQILLASPHVDLDVDVDLDLYLDVVVDADVVAVVHLDEPTV